MDLLTTLSGSLMEGFFPAGWDLAKIDACVDANPATITDRQKWWHPKFQPFPCQSQASDGGVLLRVALRARVFGFMRRAA